MTLLYLALDQNSPALSGSHFEALTRNYSLCKLLAASGELSVLLSNISALVHLFT